MDNKNQPIPFNVVMSDVKRALKQFILTEKARTRLPSYVMASIMGDVLSELRSDEIDELIEALTQRKQEEGESGNDNANEQS